MSESSEFRNIGRFSARCGHPFNRASLPGREQNVSRGTPRGTTKGEADGRNVLWWSAGKRNPLQLPLRGKPDVLAIRRPERLSCVLGPGERLRLHRINGAHEKQSGHERDVASI